MLPLDNVVPLTDFLRNTTAHRKRLRSSSEPTVLTVDGRVELVVFHARAYQKLIEKLDAAETILAVRDGLEDVKAGRVKSLAQSSAEIRKRLGLPPRRKR